MNLAIGDEMQDLSTAAVIYNNEPDFYLNYFDVYFGRPVPGLCVFVYETPALMFDFMDELDNEMRYWQVTSCEVFSIVPLEAYNLLYVGVAQDKDFGPFHAYRYAP